VKFGGWRGEFATAESAACYGRVGVSTQEFGGLCHWLINVLNIVTGNFDRPGGAMFTLPAFDPWTLPQSVASRGNFGRWHSRVRKLPEFSGELPVAVLAEEILTEGPGQIKALVTCAGNPVLSTPNGRELDQALASLEFMVSLDFYVNETTRHAHIILPPTSPLERNNYDIAFNILAVRNTAKFSPALFAPQGETKDDWEILLELQTRIENDGLRGSLKRQFMKRLLPPDRILDLGLRFGPHKLSLRKVRDAVHGIDLGALEPCMPGRLRTADKRVALAPAPMVKDIERVKERLLGATAHLNGHLSLIGRRQLRSNNSWMHNAERLVKGNPAKPPCTILMHPADAAQRDLTAGEHVLVRSKVGEIVVPVEISKEMMPGVVSIPHGWGHDREGSQLSVAQQHAGGSINDLTDNQAIDELCGTAAFSGTPVTVERYTRDEAR
jgi:anaerobic selenocysteine-containing dehydrogenase